MMRGEIRTFSMNRLRLSALLAAFLIVAAKPLADKITYQTQSGGTDVVHGSATKTADGWLVRVKGEGGEIELVLDNSVILSVEAGEEAPLTDEIAVLIAGNPEKAVTDLLARYKNYPTRQDETADYFRQALATYLSKLYGMYQAPTNQEAIQKAIQDYEKLTLDLGDPAAKKMLGDQHAQILNQIRQQQSQADKALSTQLAREAVNAIRAGNVTRDIEKQLDRAKRLDPNNVNVHYAQMLFYSQPGFTNKGNVLFAANAVINDNSDPARVREATDLIAAINTSGQVRPPGGAQPVAPTPVSTQPSVQPTPTPPAGTASNPIPTGSSEKSYFDRLKSGDWSVFGDIVSDVLAGEHLEYVIGIPAFILLFWIIPAKILRDRARKGSFSASIWGPRVRFIGVFALLGYMVGSVRLPKRGGGETCPVCRKYIDNIEDYSDFNFLVCPHCGENVTPVYNLDDYIQHLVEQVGREVGRRHGQYSSSSVENDATLKLVRAILVRGVRTRASDLHIDIEADGAKVRGRIDGVLYDSLFLPKPIVSSIVSAIKVMANLDIAERRIPQDGKLSMWVDKADIDVRVNTSPSVHGEKVSMRLLDNRSIQIGPADLGFEGKNLAFFEQAIRRPHGMIIVTGPSGSGKSTTLYVALNSINVGDKNIITLEDPIEYALKGLNQMQVNPAADFTFATGLRSIVRQDPDVIMVGEVRDKQTAEMAIEAAITGHLLMTTLHTIDTTTVFTRLSDMGINTRRYAAALVLILAQRLARINCPECKRPYQPEPKYLSALHLDRSAKDIVFLKGQGCTHCQQTGYFGRMGLFEVFAPDRHVATLLEQNAGASEIRKVARRKGMHNIREEGIHKVMRGITTVEEVIRATT